MSWDLKAMHFSLKENVTVGMVKRVKTGEESVREWADAFNDFWEKLRVKVG